MLFEHNISKLRNAPVWGTDIQPGPTWAKPALEKLGQQIYFKNFAVIRYNAGGY